MSTPSASAGHHAAQVPSSSSPALSGNQAAAATAQQSSMTQQGVQFGETPTKQQLLVEIDSLTIDPTLPPPGLARYQEVRRRFLQRKIPYKPIPGEPMDVDAITDAIEDCPGDRLEPPVPLDYMAEVLVEIWEDEGLYDN